MPQTIAFWTIAGLYATLLFASSAPSPLYVVYQAQWHFSASTLTVVFAVYVFALLAALVVTGSLSDHIGRRPTLLAAGVVQIASMITFALADGVGWLALARILQGLATGIATGALSAWILDLQPEDRPRLGATVGSLAPAAGLALGAIGAGLLVQYAPAPTRLVYWLLVAVFVVGLIASLAIPETVTGGEPWWRALRPHIGIAGQSRAAFIAATPLLVASWALSGLFLSLGGSLTAVVLHSRSHVVGGLVVLALAGVGVLATLATTRFAPTALMLGGAVALIVGVAVALIGLHETSTSVFFLGSCIAGAGFGPAWTGAFRMVVVTAPPTERAALVAAVFLVCYLAFSVPAIVVGIAVGHIGLLRATTWYGVAVMLLVAIAAAATLLRRVHDAGTAHVSSPRVSPPACPGTAAIHPDTVILDDPVATTPGPSDRRGPPATAVISRAVDPGHREDYERWLVGMIAAAARFPNNLGVVVLAPKPGEADVFALVHRFADEASLRAWEESDVRRQLSSEADTFSTAYRQAATGLETWFTISGAPSPPRWKMAVVTFVVVYVITWIIIPREQAWLPRSWPFYATNVVTNAIIALLMTYAVMPLTARVLRRWLYGRPNDRAANRSSPVAAPTSDARRQPKEIS